MCGIVGVLGKDSYHFIRQNLDGLKHRGPDYQGIIALDQNLTLGATRLAMTDPLPRSNQPMVDRQTLNTIVFNGEIYNFKTLRKNLAGTGINFETESDTEVILKALGKYGKYYVKYLEGMFAFGFYDKINNSLLLGRDYLGKKPLYYSIGKNYLVFSSKISVVKNFINRVSMDNIALSTYLKLGYLISPYTMFKEIKSVQPGEIIEINLNSLSIIDRIKITPDSIINPPQTEIREILENAFLDRVSGHLSYAVSMSGGIDSTIIALLSAKFGLNCTNYSIRWLESDKIKYNLDSTNAQTISKNLKLPLQIVDMPSVTKVPNLLSNFVSAMEEPNSNPTGLSMMALYNQISSDGNRLILTGDGSDEIFLGYDRYKKINKMKLWPKLSPKYLATLGLDINSRNKLGAKLALFLTHEKNWNFWYYWQQIAKDKYLTSFFNNYEKLNTENYNDEFTNTLINQREFLILTMYRDLRIWLSMESNNKLDKVSMAFSMEARSPFQSEKLIGAVYKKIHGGKTDFLGKKLLTDQFTELKKLPVNIDKMGFVSPLGHWLRKNPQMIHDCIKYLKKNFDFDINELNNLVESPQRGDYDRFRFLWSLIVLAYWHEAQIN